MPGRRKASQDIADWEPGCEWRQGWLDGAAYLSEADRQQLADALGLDPLGVHFRASSTVLQLRSPNPNIDQPTGEYVSLVDEAHEEILAALHRYAATFFGVDRAASIAQVRKHLRLIAHHPDRYACRIDHLDPNTLDCLAPFLPSREPSLGRTGTLDPAVLAQAAERALDVLPPPRPGRPPGTGSLAWKRLAEDLADFFLRYATKPTRRVHERGRESGPFRDFVEFVVSKIPSALRTTGKGHIKRVDYLVRVGIQSLRPPCPRKRRSKSHITP